MRSSEKATLLLGGLIILIVVTCLMTIFAINPKLNAIIKKLEVTQTLDCVEKCGCGQTQGEVR